MSTTRKPTNRRTRPESPSADPDPMKILADTRRTLLKLVANIDAFTAVEGIAEEDQQPT